MTGKLFRTRKWIIRINFPMHKLLASCRSWLIGFAREPMVSSMQRFAKPRVRCVWLSVELWRGSVLLALSWKVICGTRFHDSNLLGTVNYHNICHKFCTYSHEVIGCNRAKSTCFHSELSCFMFSWLSLIISRLAKPVFTGSAGHSSFKSVYHLHYC